MEPMQAIIIGVGAGLVLIAVLLGVSFAVKKKNNRRKAAHTADLEAGVTGDLGELYHVEKTPPTAAKGRAVGGIVFNGKDISCSKCCLWPAVQNSSLCYWCESTGSKEGTPSSSLTFSSLTSKVPGLSRLSGKLGFGSLKTGGSLTGGSSLTGGGSLVNKKKAAHTQAAASSQNNNDTETATVPPPSSTTSNASTSSVLVMHGGEGELPQPMNRTVGAVIDLDTSENRNDLTSPTFPVLKSAPEPVKYATSRKERHQPLAPQPMSIEPESPSMSLEDDDLDIDGMLEKFGVQVNGGLSKIRESREL